MDSRHVFAVAGLIATVAFGAASAAAQSTTRVSVAADGGQGNGPSYFGGASTNARYVVFSSDATNLVPGDTNGKTDVFRRDRTSGETVRISVDDDGVQSNGRSFASGVSRDGRLVLFWSHATNLVGGDTNGFEDVFLRDVALHTTTRLSLGPNGVQTNGGNRFPTMSDDGRWVAFQSYASNVVLGDTNDREDIYVLDRRTGQTTRVGQPSEGQSNDDSLGPQISPNGRYLAFESDASNLVPGDTNGAIDAFVVDRTRGTLVRASVSDAGVEGNLQSRSPIVSSNGRWVLFLSAADNLVAGDTNHVFDSFLHDLRRGETRRVSVSSNGTEGNFGSSRGTLDPKGRYVAFGSHANNLVAGDTNAAADVFVRDLARGTTIRVSAAHDGGETNGDSQAIGFADSRTLLVASPAGNLVAGDTNATDDLFMLRWR
ncbi:MAG TPA: hypothetical protein VGR62_10615 [Candidatus Binatia bacterium]|jgi:Tol biopolymer transport system component|nr:hypothetical protein [Candidatus Binatia bacterium]